VLPALDRVNGSCCLPEVGCGGFNHSLTGLSRRFNRILLGRIQPTPEVHMPHYWSALDIARP